MQQVVRVLVGGWVVVVLVAATRTAWSQRDLLVAVWRAMRPRLLGEAVLVLALVAGVATAVATLLPATANGLGTLLDFEANAVFVPLDAAVALTPETPSVDVAYLAVVAGFLVALGLLLPWLAFVEEEQFRAGQESLPLGREIASALVFGAAHLLVLVPVSAALGIATAGFVYGRRYRAAVRAGTVADGSPVGAAHLAATPAAARRAYRPGRRARRGTAPASLQAAGVFHATTLHAAVNTLVLVAVLVGAVVVEFTVA